MQVKIVQLIVRNLIFYNNIADKNDQKEFYKFLTEEAEGMKTPKIKCK